MIIRLWIGMIILITNNVDSPTIIMYHISVITFATKQQPGGENRD
jgi:hypothetical protein